MAAEVLISVGILALTLAAVLSVARRALLYPDAFADRLASSLADPRVASFVADRLTGAVIREDPDLTAFRPFILATARGAVASTSFQALVRTTARAAHASLFSEGGRSVIVSVPDVGVLLKSALAKTNPALAERVPAQVQGILTSVGESRVDRVVLRLWQIARRSFWLAAALFIGGPLLAVIGVLTASSRRRGLVRLGLDLVVAGLVLLLLVPAGRAIVSLLAHDPLARQAAAGLWDAFTGHLRTWGYVFLGMGLVIQAAGRSLMERLDPRASARRLVGWLENPPGGRRGRLARGAILLGGGGFALLRPSDAVWLASVLLGGAVASIGLREIFEIVLSTMPEPEAASLPSAASSAVQRGAVVVTLAATFVAAIAVVGRPRPAIRPATDACNGAPELCALRFDAIVFPGTHNSMSAADIPDWLFPQQEKGIPTQLQDGIRALLLDVHYGIPVEGRVKTDLTADPGLMGKVDKAIGKEAVDAAMRIRDRLVGKEEGPRDLYLCHGLCELGATSLATTLRQIHEFMVENPSEVLVFVIEDYVSPQDLAATFAKSGLDSLVFRGAPAPPWPTLREMIDLRQRVVVFTESGRSGVPWIHPAFEGMQETPYSFHSPSELSCVANRGGTSGSLFLMNNWIETTPAPKPSNAAIVNGYEALLARARQCETERHKRPNVIAVDFYRTGDLFRVARALNGPAGP
jgi:hypothetical protein